MESRLNDRERFLAVALKQEPDYIPIFGFPGAPGMSRGCQKPAHQRLFATGMPLCVTKGQKDDVENWYRYWGTTGPATLDFSLHGELKA